MKHFFKRSNKKCPQTGVQKDYKQVQSNGFNKLKEMTSAFSNDANIISILNRLEDKFSEYIILDINWEELLLKIEKSVETNDMQEFSKLLWRIYNYCEEFSN